MKRTLATLLILAPLAGSAVAALVPNGEFNLTKPGEPTVTATPTAYVPWPGSIPSPLNLTVGSGGTASYGDGGSGTTVDFLGWTKIQGNVDFLMDGVGGSMSAHIFASWGGDARIETDAAVGTVEANKIYTISAQVNGGSGSPIDGPLAFHLVANGSQLAPSASSPDPVGGSGFQTISRTYDTDSTSGHIGEDLTIIVGVEDANDNGGPMIWDDVSLDVTDAPAPVTFPLTITPTVGSPGNYDFAWESLDNFLYDLVSHTDLSTDPATWPVWDSRAGLVGTAPTDEFLSVPGGVDPARYFAVIRKDPPPLFSEDFESDDGGFTFSSSAGTDWAWGTPMSNDDGGTANPGGSVTEGNGNSLKCWGTGLGNPGYYANPTTDSCLRTPNFSLAGVTTATLTFAQALDFEAPDVAVVKLIKAVDDSEIATVYTASDGEISAAAWEPANGGTPIDLSVGIGETVYLQWCLTGTAGADYMGWYIDDVEVNAN